jgi:benzylsuccinate CoA-transferase BbsF subunit
MKKRPLEGIRVVDLAMIWAGAATTQYLGVMGAEVIKIEAGRRPDTTRGNWPPAPTTAYADDDPGRDPWNRTGHYQERNRNKYSLVLDLTTPEGQQAVKKLVQLSDIVAENFRVGVMDRLGLGYEELRRLKPDIIMISMSSQGVTGPERTYGSFGNILEQTGGLAAITGYPGDTPRSLGIQFPDPLTAGISPGLIIAALRHRNRTGKGMHIDLSQRELATYAIGEVFLDYVMNGRVWGTIGNQDPYVAPQGCYPCRGEERWVAISVRNDVQWQALCKAIGQPELANDPRFATVQQRRAQHDALDRIIGQWTSTQDNRQVMDALQKLGISAGAVLDGRDFVEDPHLTSRGFWETVDQGGAGIRRHMRPPYGFTRIPLATRFRAPTFGEHNRLVLKEYLGYSEQELDALEKQRVLEYKPHWAAQLKGERQGPGDAGENAKAI